MVPPWPNHVDVQRIQCSQRGTQEKARLTNLFLWSSMSVWIWAISQSSALKVRCMMNFDSQSHGSQLFRVFYWFVPAGRHFSFHFSGISLPRKPLCILFVSPGVCHLSNDSTKWHMMIIWLKNQLYIMFQIGLALLLCLSTQIWTGNFRCSKFWPAIGWY